MNDATLDELPYVAAVLAKARSHLHALGVDQHELYYFYNNRKELLTVNGGQVIKEVFT